MQHDDRKLVGVILAGGEGRRLGGLDKGLQLYQSVALIDHVINRIAPQVDDLLICANRNLEQYQSFGHRVIQDQSTNFQGPMAGISTALSYLQQSDYENAMIVSCDTPKLPSDLVEKLSCAKHHGVAVAHDGTRRQNLHCLIHRRAWGSLINAYQNGERAMHHWLNKAVAAEVDFSNQAACFMNINTPEHLELS